MSNQISASSLSAKIVLHLLYTSATYTTCANAVKPFSSSVSKTLSEFAAVDASIAGLLTPLIHLFAEGECEKKGEPAPAQVAVPTMVLPVVFTIPVFKKDDSETPALFILNSLLLLEVDTYKTLSSMCKEPAAHELTSIASVEMLAEASRQRAIELKNLIKSIVESNFWSRPGTWQCSKCGVSYDFAPENCNSCFSGKNTLIFKGV